jgi:twitching motility protein PilU
VDFNALLALMVQKNSFDLFITAGRAPTMKIDGLLVEVSKTFLSKEQTLALVLSLMEPRQKEEFYKTKECLFAIGVPKVGRFRISAFIQRDAAGMVLHRIKNDIPEIDSLDLPEILKSLALEKRGLILFAGPLGSGKSTTLSSIIQYRNENSGGHMIVLDDPMEYMHSHRGCIVTQREVGLDTESYEVALKNAMQQSPNVVALGEICTREAMQMVINIVNSGRLCLSTVYGNNAEQTIERILNFFPDEMHRQVRIDLARSLLGIVSQQMLRCSKGKNHVIAEVLINTPAVQDVIRKGDSQRFKELILKGGDVGMQSFDQARCDLFLQKKISYEDALDSAEYKNEFRLMVKETMEKMEANKSSETLASAEQNDSVTSSEQENKLPNLLASQEITLSDIYDDDSDMGSIFTHR